MVEVRYGTGRRVTCRPCCHTAVRQARMSAVARSSMPAAHCLCLPRACHARAHAVAVLGRWQA